MCHLSDHKRVGGGGGGQMSNSLGGNAMERLVTCVTVCDPYRIK